MARHGGSSICLRNCIYVNYVCLCVCVCASCGAHTRLCGCVVWVCGYGYGNGYSETFKRRRRRTFLEKLTANHTLTFITFACTCTYTAHTVSHTAHCLNLHIVIPFIYLMICAPPLVPPWPFSSRV
jgi:hypothetical protein